MTEIPDFDGVARAYRWMEYLALGTMLEQTREEYLGRLQKCRQALILGDGDGRFTAKLLATNPDIRVAAVDASAAMLALLEKRCAPYADRLKTQRADARGFRPSIAPDLIAPDLVVTHFFLDCLTQAEVDELVGGLTPLLSGDALWAVSEFRLPGGIWHIPAWVYVRLLYSAFGVLTGLKVRRLPDYAAALRVNGFVRIAAHRRLFGLLTAEVWRRQIAV